MQHSKPWWHFWRGAEPQGQEAPVTAVPSKYRIERLDSDWASNDGNRRYRIWRGSELLGYVLHDFRLDYHWFEIGAATYGLDAGEPFPLDWGPNNPVHLTASGEERLDNLLKQLNI